jgi:hypothetical protein
MTTLEVGLECVSLPNAPQVSGLDIHVEGAVGNINREADIPSGSTTR